MASGSYNQVYVRCPFYLRDDGKQKLACEGIVADSTINIHFARTADMKQQMDIFCCDHYKNCEIYRMLMEAKY